MLHADRIIGGRYHLRRRIGAGSFGEIYSAEDIRTHRRVAVKFESCRCRAPQLAYEAKLYGIFSGGIGVPRLHWYGTEDTHNIMVIDLLGKSLEDHFINCCHRLSLKTVLMLADQMIACVEYLHSKSFIHRDIKPDNFVMGIGPQANQVFIIDYGLSKKYQDQHTHVHIPYVEGKSLTGTARYASVGALRGVEQSRRDDLESLGFVWLYLLRGSLPWMGLHIRDQGKKYEKICEAKNRTSFNELCRGFPIEFVRYFETVRNLKFTETPDYAALRSAFRELFIRHGYAYDYKYDWNAQPPPATPLLSKREEPPVAQPLESPHPVETRESQRPEEVSARKKPAVRAPSPARLGRVEKPLQVSTMRTARRSESKGKLQVTIQQEPGKQSRVVRKVSREPKVDLPPSSSMATFFSKDVSRWLEETPKITARRARGPLHVEGPRKVIYPPWMTQHPLTRTTRLGQNS
jgi:casein kinase 1